MEVQSNPANPYVPPEPEKHDLDAIRFKLFKQEAAVRRGGNEALLIAGVTIINIVFAIVKIQLFFPVGLFYPIFFAANFLLDFQLRLIFFTTLAAVAYVLLGLIARKGNRIAYIAILLSYMIDGIIALSFQDYVGVGLHAFFLLIMYGCFANISAAAKTRRLLAEISQSTS